MRVTGLRSVAIAAVLALGMSACSTTVPSTHVGAPTANGPDTTQAPSSDAAPTKGATTADPSTQSLKIHLTASLGGMIGSDSPVDVTIVTDGPDKRFALSTKGFDVSGGTLAPGTGASQAVPGFEVRGQRGDDQTDVYVRRSGQTSWTHVVLGKDFDLGQGLDLGGGFDQLPGELTDPGRFLQKLQDDEIPGITLADDGTVDYKGEKMTRKVATIDLGEALQGMAPGTRPGSPDANGDNEIPDDLKGMLDSGPLTEMLPKGTVTVLIDQNSMPRKVTVDLSMGEGDQAGEGNVVATIDPTGSGSVELPSADQVGKTVRIDSPEDAMHAAEELESLLEEN